MSALAIRCFLILITVGFFAESVAGQFDRFKRPNVLPKLKGENQDSSSDTRSHALPEKIIRNELESRLNKLPSIQAWEAMDDYDGPVAMLMSLLSPDGVEDVKQAYLRESLAKLKTKGTPKLSAEAAMNEFARNLAWELKKVAARSPYRLTLVLGNVVAKDDAQQSLVDDVFTQLVENESLTNDFVIISVPRGQADKIIGQLSGSADIFIKPDGSNANTVEQQTYHPDSIYVIDGTLRQWHGEQAQEFHTEFSARIYHPRTQTMIGGKEIRQNETYYYHPTHQWISSREDETLARQAPTQQAELSRAFRAAAPVARQTMISHLVARNKTQAKTGQTLILVNAGARELAQREYKDRLSVMSSAIAWKNLEQPDSNAGTLLAMISPGGVAEARSRYSRRARHAMRFQSTPRLAMEQMVHDFVAAVAKHMENTNASTGRRPVLVLGEVASDDPQMQRMIYDIYAKLHENAELRKVCVIIGLAPDKAQAIIDDLSNGIDTYAVPEEVNISDVDIVEVNTADMFIIQGRFAQALSDQGRRFHSEITTSLKPVGKQNNAREGLALRQEVTYFYHPIHAWIANKQEAMLQDQYDPNRDNGPLPERLVKMAKEETALSDENKPGRNKSPLGGLKNRFGR